jgi:hypothetical protein
MQRPAPQPALIRSSLLQASDSVGLSGELEPVTMKMPMKIPMRVPTKPHPGREGRSAHPLESSDEDQPTTGGTLTPDSCRRSANGLSTPPDTFEPFTVGGGKAAPPGLLPDLRGPREPPEGLGQSPHSFGMPFDADPAEGVIDHALVMQGIDARYTAESLLEEIYHSGFAYPRDIHLFYLPCDAAGASMGRCFLAFDAVSTRNQFIAAWQGKRMLLARLTDAVSFATVTTKDVLSLFADCKEAISEEPAEVPAAPAVQGRASRFCTRCGGRVDAQRGDKFCAACGAPVRGA